jgi:hypothetical protein
MSGDKAPSQLHRFFKNVLMIDPVRQRGLYRFTLASIPLMAGMLIASAYAEDEMQRRIDVMRRDRERMRRVADEEKLRKVRFKLFNLRVITSLSHTHVSSCSRTTRPPLLTTNAFAPWTSRPRLRLSTHPSTHLLLLARRPRESRRLSLAAPER